MIISFDIDNTLIPVSDEFPIEKNFYTRLIGGEYLRKGTHQLFHKLTHHGHEIWIYTTSHRSTFHLRKTFLAYGLSPKRYINATINQKHLSLHNCTASKNPKLFGIDLHIDDSPGVAIEAQRYGFKTMIISPDNLNWVEDILQHINLT